MERRRACSCGEALLVIAYTPRFNSLRGGSHDQDGNVRMPEDPFGRAAEQRPRNPGSAMGPQDDQIRLPLRGGFDDLPARTPFYEIFPRWGITSNSKRGGFQKPSPLLPKGIQNSGGRQT